MIPWSSFAAKVDNSCAEKEDIECSHDPYYAFSSAEK